MYLLIFFCHFGSCFIQMGVLKWKVSNCVSYICMPCDRLNDHLLPCDRLNYHPLPCDRLNWHTLLNQSEDRKFTWNIIKSIGKHYHIIANKMSWYFYVSFWSERWLLFLLIMLELLMVNFLLIKNHHIRLYFVSLSRFLVLVMVGVDMEAN